MTPAIFAATNMLFQVHLEGQTTFSNATGERHDVNVLLMGIAYCNLKTHTGPRDYAA
jgi:hypothetical protein